jgi:hypothetical protein
VTAAKPYSKLELDFMRSLTAHHAELGNAKALDDARVFANLDEVERERDAWKRAFLRAHCGCTASDCTVHGGYDPEDVRKALTAVVEEQAARVARRTGR